MNDDDPKKKFIKHLPAAIEQLNKTTMPVILSDSGERVDVPLMQSSCNEADGTICVKIISPLLHENTLSVEPKKKH